jgi:hypothetical protein
MTVTVKNIIPRIQITNSQTSQYVATNCKTVIDKFTVTNTSGAAVTISVNLVPNGGSALASNCVLYLKNIQPSETYNCPELVGQSLEPGGFISTIAGAATALTASATGREIT